MARVQYALALWMTLQWFTLVSAQDCPQDWEAHQDNCYKFVNYPEQTYDEAMQKCVNNYATLVSVNDRQEHNFLVGRLRALSSTISQGWYTSGSNDVWEGDGTDILKDQDYWLDNKDRIVKESNKVVIYQRQDSGFLFKRVKRGDERAYVCEIAKAEVMRMFQSPRDYSFGVDKVVKETDIKFAPRLTYNPSNVLIVGEPTQIYIECIATGNPKPSYKWYRGTVEGQVIDPTSPKTQEITTKAFSDYTLTNGRMTISNPSSSSHQGDYQCRVQNTYGTILGNPVSLTFGLLAEFSNIDPAAVFANGDKGTQIQCPPIEHNGALKYQWSKDDVLNFVRPESNKHIFISSNGKLYFSRIQQDDAGYYYCIVELNSPTNRGYIGSQRIVTRTSRPVKLDVGSADGGNQKPQIQDDFIAVFPELPKVNQNIQLECFAFGTMLEYSWKRYDSAGKIGVPLPNHRLMDHNRILVIPSVQIKDSGLYSCSVYSSESKNGHTKNQTVTIESPPIFSTELKNQFVDVGMQLTWRCMAEGIPKPTYTWFHNGKQIRSNNQKRITVNRNVIVIKDLSKRDHNGVYQCAAKNLYGTSFTSAELRVLSFKPTFSKQHMPEKVIGAIGGSVRIRCNPEAAPFPTFVWRKDGNEIASSASFGNTGDRVRVRGDGTLTVRDISLGDEGRYECVATNSEGDATIATTFKVLQATVINTKPYSQKAMVNGSATLSCEASHHPNLDMIYKWYFNNRIINTENNLHFIADQRDDPGSLTIRDIQFIHAGRYTCVAMTQADSSNASAIVRVIGPPSEPSGVYVSPPSISNTSMILKWTDGDDHGSPISAYFVEGSTKFDNYREWQILPSEQVTGGEQSGNTLGNLRVVMRVLNLNPRTLYKFRVRAVNSYGRSRPSQPSVAFTTLNSAPTKAPTEVGGGGGKVGVLTITWKPLSKMEHHGKGIGYRVFWKRKYMKVDWHHHKLSGQASRFVTLVGIALSYQKYDVMVQAYNDEGYGPNSTVRTVHAAADLPKGTPTLPYGEGFNSTALRIYWIKVNDSYEEIRGKLLGYKINYWEMEKEVESQARQAVLPGQANSGLLIGLEPDTFYRFNIQVYNSAGNGPKSETYEQSTFNLPPQLYPTEVYVNSIKNEIGAVKVRWRGVSTTTGEEPLQGYIVRYWVHGTDIRNATDLRLGRINEAKITGIKKDYRYQLRVLGYSRGGFGKMSMPTLTFILHDSRVNIDPAVSEILSSATHFTLSQTLLFTVVLFTLL